MWQPDPAWPSEAGWQPDPAWQRLPGGRSSAGLWLAEAGGRRWVVKRLVAPLPGDPATLRRPGHLGYWRREADVALHAVLAGPGLRSPAVGRVDEDELGVTVWTEAVEVEQPPGPFVARALGRFAGTSLPDAPWLCRHLLADRIALTEAHDGWPTLGRTTLSDVADVLWRRRRGLLAAYEALPRGPAHGDAVPANFVGRAGADAVAVDWACLGTAPLGADLGYFSLSAREDFDVLHEAYLDGLASVEVAADPPAVALAARTLAVFTVMSRAEWALARVARGEGALAGKFRHPAVAPHLRALQRQFPQIEALLGM
ncbi:MAG TPA: phosphotransferase [Marmoricola sp.]|nr:phosphotransferase [Marmoricola sp.]